LTVSHRFVVLQLTQQAISQRYGSALSSPSSPFLLSFSLFFSLHRLRSATKLTHALVAQQYGYVCFCFLFSLASCLILAFFLFFSPSVCSSSTRKYLKVKDNSNNKDKLTHKEIAAIFGHLDEERKKKKDAIRTAQAQAKANGGESKDDATHTSTTDSETDEKGNPKTKPTKKLTHKEIATLYGSPLSVLLLAVSLFILLTSFCFSLLLFSIFLFSIFLFSFLFSYQNSKVKKLCKNCKR
jgi:hypothetical protein